MTDQQGNVYKPSLLAPKNEWWRISRQASLEMVNLLRPT